MRAYKARLRGLQGGLLKHARLQSAPTGATRRALETCALTKRAYRGDKEGYSELETDTKVNTELCAANGFCFNLPAAEAHYA